MNKFRGQPGYPTDRKIHMWVSRGCLPPHSSRGSGSAHSFSPSECLKLMALHRLSVELREQGFAGLPLPFIGEFWKHLDYHDVWLCVRGAIALTARIER